MSATTGTFTMPEPDTIFGYTWDEISGLQQKQGPSRTIDTTKPGDYGATSLGDGSFRMVPSGDIVDFEERNRRLAR